MHANVSWIGLLLVAVPVGAQQPVTGQPAPGGPSRPSSTEVAPSPRKLHLVPEVSAWQWEFAQLKAEREALQAERNKVSAEPEEGNSAAENQMTQLRLRVNQLLTQMAFQSARNRMSAPGKPAAPRVPASVTLEPLPAPPPSPPPAPPEPTLQKPSPAAQPNEPEIPIRVEINRPVDPLALAQSLFRSDDYAGALRAYRLIDPTSLSADNRLMIQYMIASCLRHLGKLEEASALYREVANAKGDEILVECAQWQLAAIQWRQQLQAELDQVRQRRKALEAKP